MVVSPIKPREVSSQAAAALLALSASGLADRLSIGGAFGLAYYHEYRSTHDVDAWWEPSVTERERKAIVECLERALVTQGEVRTRSWGDVTSIEVSRDGKREFSFQIALRDARLGGPVEAPWPPGMRIDSLDDLLAAKMVALVERGAPRDFRDVRELCRAGLAEPLRCWDLWRRRQTLARGDTSADRARLAVASHLTRIELHRPLDSIRDSSDRSRARALREWFRRGFLDALVD